MLLSWMNDIDERTVSFILVLKMLLTIDIGVGCSLTVEGRGNNSTDTKLSNLEYRHSTRPSTCVGCSSRYIGETTRHLTTRMLEHTQTDKNSNNLIWSLKYTILTGENLLHQISTPFHVIECFLAQPEPVGINATLRPSLGIELATLWI